jgi:hypothetical protein
MNSKYVIRRIALQHGKAMLHPGGDKDCKRRFHGENLIPHLHFDDDISLFSVAAI